MGHGLRWAKTVVAVVGLAACADVGGSGAPSGTAAGWTELPAGPLGARYGATAAWVDGQLLVLGGRDTDPCPPGADCGLPAEPPLQDGARFDPSTQRWTTIAALPVTFEYARTAVLDDTLFVWAPRPGNRGEPSFLAYSLADDHWEVLPLPDDAADRLVELAVTDDAVVIIESTHELGRRPDLLYDPTTQTFTSLPDDPLGPSFDRDLTFVDGLLVLTAIDITPSPGGSSGPARYRAATWTDEAGWDELTTGAVVGWDPDWFAVDTMLVNATPGRTRGSSPEDATFPFGGVLDPSDGTWSDLPDPPDGSAATHVTSRSLGDDRLLMNSSGWAYLPDDGRWVEPGLPDGAEASAAVAVGDGRLYVVGGVRWQGNADYRLLESAWVYDPGLG